ncbi:MAG TPA: hypothetical protein PKM41_11235 [Deltaproteobacteria bacterium]|jgi:hypothetical protein|nr:hypothetical protein [Deltaproteobacteria bacterium]HOI07241.1 hypothetical protein [Deltaproteobacteria bacterium]
MNQKVNKEEIRERLKPYIPLSIISDMLENRVMNDLSDVLYAAVDYYTEGNEQALEEAHRVEVRSIDQLIEKMRQWGTAREEGIDKDRLREMLEEYLPDDIVQEALEGEGTGDLWDILHIAVDYFTDGDNRAFDAIKGIRIESADELMDHVRAWHNMVSAPNIWYNPEQGEEMGVGAQTEEMPLDEQEELEGEEEQDEEQREQED